VTELLIATKKGLVVLEGDPGTGFRQTARLFAGEPVDYAMRDPRSGRLLASVTSPFYGPKIWYADDAAGEWSQASGLKLPDDSDAALARIWTIVAGEDAQTVYAGGDPGVLFESRDGGETWSVNEALWQHPTRPSWEAGGGGLSIHRIVPWPGDPQRLALGVSAAGIWLTEDGGASWTRGNKGIRPRYLPEEAREEATDLCIHSMQRAPARPERIFMQFHGGVYRSDDAGQTWTDIADGLPADFGFPIAVDPADPDSAFVIPLTADMDRVTVDGRVRVFATRDAGASWSALGEGLPQEHAYLTVLRHGFAHTGEGPALELYFGTTSGHVFGSGDAGASWSAACDCLPTVHSVVAVG
jgi:photosystem II stability/assembly factor-like uncharacterized protein